jgi:formylglycine-generating enzyme
MLLAHQMPKFRTFAMKKSPVSYTVALLAGALGLILVRSHGPSPTATSEALELGGEPHIEAVLANNTSIAKAKDYINSLSMKMIHITPGEFTMGSDQGEWDEKPVHKARITQAFYMAATEVTNAQYEQFDPKHKGLRGKLGFAKEDDEAVVFVSWHDAVQFCAWLSQKEGKRYRLPTEAEWEYTCRAGTTTAYHTGKQLPKAFHKNVFSDSWAGSWYPSPYKQSPQEVHPLTVATTPANSWGLFDMHGNVEEWCYDWYGPYIGGEQVDPVGRADGDFRVTRGGSHSTELAYLRSCCRLGALPENRSWLIGFRVVQGELPVTKPLPAVAPPANQRDVVQKIPKDLKHGPDPKLPYFVGPRQFVKIMPESNGPLFSQHSHCPAIVNCPNGDLLAVWYTCRNEPGRELALAASRLRYGAKEWEPASPFWDAPGRNDSSTALWVDGQGTLHHFNGLSAAATWGNMATILRTSKDNGATWSKARFIMAEYGERHAPQVSVLQTKSGAILVPCHASVGGYKGTNLLMSSDQGHTWTDLAPGQKKLIVAKGNKGPAIAGYHGTIVELEDGRLLALGRENDIDDRMPMSISADGGNTWTYDSSPFPGIAGGQRAVLLRLREGPIFFASFAKNIMITDASGTSRSVSGLFAALSHDEGKTWEVKRPITVEGSPVTVEGLGVRKAVMISPAAAEPLGYLAACQSANGVIHLITSKNHYAFNLAWLQTPAPPQQVIEHQRNIHFFDGPVRCVVFSPDGKVVAGGGNRDVRWFDVKTGDRLQILKGHADEVNTIAFAADGATLASGSRDKTIRLWETKSGKLIKVLLGGSDGKGHVHLKDQPISCVAFLPDGKTLISCGTNNYVTFWDLASGLWERKAWTNHADKGYRDGCYHVVISNDGQLCAVAGGVCPQRFTRQVSVFHLDHGLKPLWNRGHDGILAATHVAFTTDGTRLLSCGQDNSVRVWEVKTGQLAKTLNGPAGNKVIQTALFTPDGKRIVAVTRTGTLCLWSLADGKLLASTKASAKGVLGMALAPDGTTLATCGEDETIQLWNLGPGKEEVGKKSGSNKEPGGKSS